jgi:hypothetical protein
MKIIDLFENEGLPEIGSPLTREAIDKWSDDIRLKLGLKFFDVSLQRNGDLKLMMIEVTNKKQGTGSKAMEALCRFADSHHRRVLLSPATKDPNKGTTSQSRLIGFYKRFGFILNKGRNKDFTISELMYRNPRGNIEEDVWHGTKHDFDQFSTDHIGTGEGNFMYGWGLYFTDLRKIADWYRKNLTDPSNKGQEVEIDGQVFIDGDPLLNERIGKFIDKYAPLEKTDFASGEETREWYKKWIIRHIRVSIFEDPKSLETPASWFKKIIRDLGGVYDDELYSIKLMTAAAFLSIKGMKYLPLKGKLYKVNIPDDANFLLWDFDFDEQSESVKNSLRATEPELFEKDEYNSWYGYDLQYRSGSSIYEDIVFIFTEKGMDRNTAKKHASLLLLKYGISGIKYYTGSTRDKLEKHYNYVLFTDQNINILHKE